VSNEFSVKYSNLTNQFSMKQSQNFFPTLGGQIIYFILFYLQKLRFLSLLQFILTIRNTFELYLYFLLYFKCIRNQNYVTDKWMNQGFV
jgi:hypothetical protein